MLRYTTADYICAEDQNSPLLQVSTAPAESLATLLAMSDLMSLHVARLELALGTYMAETQCAAFASY